MTVVLRVAILNQLILKDMKCSMSSKYHGKPIVKGNHCSIDRTVRTCIAGGNKPLKVVVRKV